MKSMPIAALEDFFASPEFEEAFNRWRAKYTAAAMVDLSPTALEPFPYQQADTPPNYIKETPAIVHYPELNEIRGFTFAQPRKGKRGKS